MSIELIALILGVIVLGFAAVAGLFGLGLYLGWFNIGPGSTAGNNDFRFTMDADRIQKDKRSVQPTALDLGGQGNGQVRTAGREGAGT